ncbi:autophagy-related protein Atg10 [Paecilomyces variotii No. 5]|uniref:Ubiquitin-like-conjugating enzyme ATG10 n=1 Tax=Byssochlamys spectabilis (strain No. 5 / NBRC 109023) TaxID=1356009 RepID=V5FNK5_BYSSN|nr:autophagy-related protein Atg10 [Paecilomyces variotii No. 5]
MLSDFPFLTPAEFDTACRVFVGRVHALGSPGVLGWTSVRWQDRHHDEYQYNASSILKISKALGPIDTSNEAGPHNHEDELSVDQVEEDDNEALIRPACPATRVEIEYSITRSPTYQVPVLYFTWRHAPPAGPRGIDTVYTYLVPDQYKDELKAVGVLGAISMGDHPETGTPAYFVHPCNTADALTQIAKDKDLDPESYLLLWFGLVGNCVGLHLPRELLVSDNRQHP